MTKMKIEVGEYVRTFNGEIAKIIGTDIEFDCKVYKTDQYIQSSRDFYVFENDSGIVKHSKNIIDLIEVGDYVNGCLIVKIYEDPFIEGQINLWTNMLFPNKYYKEKITDKNIKTIVTKEQFNNMEYKINE